ncbi:MAG: hypothetical protein WCH39_11315 [Schlesneria sp.]
MGIPSNDSNTSFLARLGLFLARFCLSAWIGAASLFVIVGVTEVTRGNFDLKTKDVLVALRFPAFYLCGVTLVSLGLLGAWVAGNSDLFPRKRRITTLVLLAIVLAVIAVDYATIYLPLLQMVTPPGQPKSDRFVTYHTASKWINLTGLVFCMIAAVLVNWPASPPRRIERQ